MRLLVGLLASFLILIPQAGALPCEAALGLSGQSSIGQSVESLFDLRSELENALYPNVDPFINALTLQDSEVLFEYLSFTEDTSDLGVKVRSVLGEIRNAINTGQADSPEELKLLVESLIQFGRESLKDSANRRTDLYRTIVALDLLLPRVLRHAPADVQLPTQNSDGVGQKQSKDQELGQTAPPEFPDAKDDYDPHTKDSKGEGDTDSQMPLIVAEITRDDVDFFVNMIWNEVSRRTAPRFRTGQLPRRVKRLSAFARTSTKLTLHLGGKSNVPLLLPTGFEPTQMDPTSQLSLEIMPSGQYRIHNPSGLDSVELFLVPEHEDLNAAQLEYLKTPLGIDESEWPLEMQAELLNKIRDLDPISAARKIESYLRNKYMYSVDAKPETDPIDALNAGAFQCDMAALIMTGIMRDVMNTPTRAVSGFRGSLHNQKSGVSVVNLPSDRHAEVQVYHNGRWHHFDPTPHRKDRISDAEKEKQEFAPIQKDYEDEEDPIEPPPESESSEASDDREDGEESAESEKSDSEPTQSEHSDLEKALKIGSLNLKQERLSGRLLNRARQIAIREALNLSYDTSIGLQKVLNLKPQVRDEADLKKLFNLADEVMTYRQRPVTDALYALSGSVKSANINQSFRLLVQVQKRLELFAMTAEAEHEQPITQQILPAIRKIKSEFIKLNSASLLEVARAKKFYDGLPPHCKRIMQQKYGFDEVSNNPGTKTMLTDLLAGRLEEMNLIRLLYPLTDFIMDSVKTPAYQEIKTYMEDRSRMRGRDFFPLDNLARSRRALLMQPNKSVVENMRQGTAFVPSHRKRVVIPANHGLTQPRRVTIVNYDTSGSMVNAPGDFQASLLAAFTDRALSDRGASGRHNHQVALLGFDAEVHSIYEIKNSEQAYDIIRNHRTKMKNTNGLTDIMAALEQSFAAILDAQKHNDGEPLAAANIILMSDGGSTIDLAKIRGWMAQVDKRTPIKFMFVAINGINRELKKLTEDLRTIGAKESYYREFDGPMISESIKAAQSPPTVDSTNELYTEKSARDLPPDLDGRLARVAFELNGVVNKINSDTRPREFSAFQHTLNLIPVQHPPNDKRTEIESELQLLRSYLANNDVYKGRPEIDLIVDDLLKNFQKLTGKPLSRLYVRERGSFGNLLQEAQRYQSGLDRIGH